MKTIPLYNAYSMLHECGVIRLEGRFLEPYVLAYEDDPDNDFLVLQWEDEHDGDTLLVEVAFKESDNQTVEIDGQKMVLMSIDGTEEELILLREMELEQEEEVRQSK